MTFLTQMSKNALHLVPNPIQNQNEVSNCRPSQVYYRVGEIYCSILNSNNIGLVGIVIIILMLKVLFRVVLVITTKCYFKEKVKSLSLPQKKKIDEDLLLGLLIHANLLISRRLVLYLIFGTQMEALRRALFAVKYPGEDGHRARGLNLALGSTVLISYGIILIWISFHYFKEKRLKAKDLFNYRKKKREGAVLKQYCYGEFKDEEELPLLVHSSNYLLYGLFSISMTVFVDSIHSQLYAVIGVLVGFLIFYILKRPHKSKVLVGITISRYVILLLLVLAMLINEMMGLTQKVLHDSVGNIFTVLFGIWVIVEGIYQLATTISVLLHAKTPLKEKKEQKFSKLLKSLSLTQVGLGKEDQFERNGDEGDKIPSEAAEKIMTLDSRMNRLKSAKFKSRISTRFTQGLSSQNFEGFKVESRPLFTTGPKELPKIEQKQENRKFASKL